MNVTPRLEVLDQMERLLVATGRGIAWADPVTHNILKLVDLALRERDHEIQRLHGDGS